MIEIYKSLEQRPLPQPRTRDRIKAVLIVIGMTILFPFSLTVLIVYGFHKLITHKDPLPSFERAPNFWHNVYVRHLDLGLNRSEGKLLKSLQPYLNEERTFFEFIQGGYLLLEDEGECYKKLHRIREKNFRLSSHRSQDPQYAIRGKFVHEALFGTIEDPKTHKKRTWIQLESAPTTYKVWDLADHFFAYIRHLYTGYNIGPYGASPYTDAKPLVIRLC